MNAPVRMFDRHDEGVPEFAPGEGPGALELSHVTHGYGAVTVVDDVSFALARGEIAGLVGHSGSGKSTLLRLIAGLERPMHGNVRIDRREMTGPSAMVPPEKRGVGMVFQDYALFPHLTVRGNVLFGMPRARRTGAVAMEALARVGMADRAGDYPHALSGGEQQRVALVRALAPGPRLLLLDEPFSNLDRRNRDTIRDQTAAILRESGTTVIVVTHEPEDAMRMADRVILLERGGIVQNGSANELFRRPASLAVARFFAEFNELRAVGGNGHADTPIGRFELPPGTTDGPVVVCLRPHDIRVDETALDSALRGTVVSRTFIGDEQMVALRVGGLDAPFRVRAPAHVAVRVGESVGFHVSTANALVFPADNGGREI